MHMIKRPQQSQQMRDTRTDNQTMHNLMTCAPDIESVWVPFLGYLLFVSSPINPLFSPPLVYDLLA
jgi:hypothetical protein